ncbi:MAG: DUF4363 family protein [Butyricicoccus sp.]|nr:DUF4363 family protein [Butyricicoccus sp.]
MKRVITAVVLLVLVVAACFGSYRYITNATTVVRDALAVTQQSVESGDFSAARVDMERSYALWRKHYNRLSTLVRHNEIDDTERLFQRARQALDNSDADESLLQLRDLRALLAHLPEMERPVYSNLI